MKTQMPQIPPEVVGVFRNELLRIFNSARRLMNGDGFPDDFEMSTNPSYRVTPTLLAHKALRSSKVYGLADLPIVDCAGFYLDTREAMLMTAWALYGYAWRGYYRDYGLVRSLADPEATDFGGDELIDAYRLLEEIFVVDSPSLGDLAREARRTSPPPGPRVLPASESLSLEFTPCTAPVSPPAGLALLSGSTSDPARLPSPPAYPQLLLPGD